MEELTIADLQQKAEEARRRYRSAPAEPQAATVAEVVREVFPSRYRIHLPDRELPPDEIARRRQELARRFPRPERRLPPPAVPERYRDARWSTWEPKCDAIETARKAVELWVRTVAEGKHVMLALVGPKGTGKSHMLACAAHQLYEENRIRAGFFEWFLVADQLRDIDTAAKVRASARGAAAHPGRVPPDVEHGLRRDRTREDHDVRLQPHAIRSARDELGEPRGTHG